MRYFIFILFFCCLLTDVFSQDFNKMKNDPNSDYEFHFYNKVEAEINASWKFVFPPPDPCAFGFVDLSAGICYGFVPEFYFLGIAGDVALGFDWFTLFSNDKTSNNNKKKDNSSLQIGISLGARIFNLFQIKHLKIWAFFGSDFLFIVYPMPYVGAELSIKMIGIEYAYFIPIFEDSPARHQLSLKFHLPKK